MTPEKKQLMLLIDRYLKPVGFKKKSNTWNLDKDDFVFVVIYKQDGVRSILLMLVYTLRALVKKKISFKIEIVK